MDLTDWLRMVTRDPDIATGATALAAYLYGHWSAGDDQPESSVIADELGIASRTIRKYRDQLEDAGYLRRDGRRISTESGGRELAFAPATRHEHVRSTRHERATRHEHDRSTRHEHVRSDATRHEHDRSTRHEHVRSVRREPSTPLIENKKQCNAAAAAGGGAREAFDLEEWSDRIRPYLAEHSLYVGRAHTDQALEYLATIEDEWPAGALAYLRIREVRDGTLTNFEKGLPALAALADDVVSDAAAHADMATGRPEPEETEEASEFLKQEHRWNEFKRSADDQVLEALRSTVLDDADSSHLKRMTENARRQHIDARMRRLWEGRS
jgi:Mn-dependent DtxR family transcriptional regulator